MLTSTPNAWNAAGERSLGNSLPLSQWWKRPACGCLLATAIRHASSASSASEVSAIAQPTTIRENRSTITEKLEPPFCGFDGLAISHPLPVGLLGLKLPVQMMRREASKRIAPGGRLARTLRLCRQAQLLH